MRLTKFYILLLSLLEEVDIAFVTVVVAAGI